MGMTSSMVAATLLTDMLCGKSSPYEDVFNPSRTILRPQLAKNAVEAFVNLLTPQPHAVPTLDARSNGTQESKHGIVLPRLRFAADGKLIDNPATGNLKVRS